MHPMRFRLSRIGMADAEGPFLLPRQEALAFHTLRDLRGQGARWMKRYNSTPRMAIGMRSPNQVEVTKLQELLETTGEVRCAKLNFVSRHLTTNIAAFTTSLFS